MDVYAENILDHYRHPRAKKSVNAPTVEHTETNVSCGDTLTVQLKFEDDRLVEVGWSGEGCAISQAGISLLSEELAGKTEGEIEALSKEQIYALLGVPVGPRRVKCALLCLHAVKNAIRKMRGEEVAGWREVMREEVVGESV